MVTFEVQQAGKNTIRIQARAGDAVVHADVIQIYKATARDKFADVVCEKSGAERSEIDQQLTKIAESFSHETEENVQKTNTAQAVQQSETIAKLLEFLRGFKFTQRTATRRIYGDDKKSALSPSELWTLPGAVELVQTMPEFLELGDRNKRSGIALAKDLFRLAGTQLWMNLPDEQPDATNIDALRDSIVTALVVPRVFYSSSGVAMNQSYARWVSALEPSEGWNQCYAHPVYGRQKSGELNLGIQPNFLVAKAPEIGRQFKDAARASGFLQTAKLIKQKAKLIKVQGRAVHIWELSDDVVESACGKPETGDENVESR